MQAMPLLYANAFCGTFRDELPVRKSVCAPQRVCLLSASHVTHTMLWNVHRFLCAHTILWNVHRSACCVGGIFTEIIIYKNCGYCSKQFILWWIVCYLAHARKYSRSPNATVLQCRSIYSYTSAVHFVIMSYVPGRRPKHCILSAQIVTDLCIIKCNKLNTRWSQFRWWFLRFIYK